MSVCTVYVPGVAANVTCSSVDTDSPPTLTSEPFASTTCRSRSLVGESHSIRTVTSCATGSVPETMSVKRSHSLFSQEAAIGSEVLLVKGPPRQVAGALPGAIDPDEGLAAYEGSGSAARAAVSAARTRREAGAMVTHLLGSTANPDSVEDARKSVRRPSDGALQNGTGTGEAGPSVHGRFLCGRDAARTSAFVLQAAI